MRHLKAKVAVQYLEKEIVQAQVSKSKDVIYFTHLISYSIIMIMVTHIGDPLDIVLLDIMLLACN